MEINSTSGQELGKDSVLMTAHVGALAGTKRITHIEAFIFTLLLLVPSP